MNIINGRSFLFRFIHSYAFINLLYFPTPQIHTHYNGIQIDLQKKKKTGLNIYIFRFLLYTFYFLVVGISIQKKKLKTLTHMIEMCRRKININHIDINTDTGLVTRINTNFRFNFWRREREKLCKHEIHVCGLISCPDYYYEPDSHNHLNWFFFFFIFILKSP